MDNISPLAVTNFLNIILLAANVQATTFLVLTLIVLLVLSFLISGAEIAFFSLTYRDINLLKTKQDSGWKRIAYLMEESRVLLASLLIANTVVNIAIIVLSNLLIDEAIEFRRDQFWPVVVLLIKVFVITAVLVLFGEILPKVRAAHNNLRTAYESSYLVEAVYYLFKRMAGWLLKMSDGLEKFFGGGVSRALSQQQLEEAIRSTVHEEDEQRILAGIYKFGSITVKQVMRTRLDVSGLDYNMSFASVKDRVEELHYSRLPVYKSNLDDIVGVIHTKDIIPFLNEEDFDWHVVLRQPFFVHEQKFIEHLLKEFQAKRVHFAVVVDEFGGTSGIVTMEDILEEIIGDIKDEFDEEETGNRQLDDGSFIFDGQTMIHNACAVMHLPPDTFDNVKGDSDSIAGLMLEVAGEIPKAGDVFTVGDFEFTIAEVDKNRIKKVKVNIRQHVNE